MSWNNKIASVNDRVLSTPVQYARRTIVADLAKIVDAETGMFDLRECSTQFAVGDMLRVIPMEGSELSSDGVDVVVEARDGFKYQLKGMPQSGKVIIVKQFKQELEPNEVGDASFAIVPVTVDMLKADDGSLRAKGIVSPGWYKWRQVVSAEDGKVVHTVAYLIVSMKGFTTDDTADEGQFDVDGQMEFDENGEMILA